MTSQRKLFVAAVSVLALNVVTATVAVAVNWPTQFGKTGTDAGADVFLTGTAISAPALPLVILIGSLVLLGKEGRRKTAGIAGIALTAVMIFIGAVGEAVAPGTPDVPKEVLFAGGVVWMVISLTVLGLAFAAIRERKQTTQLAQRV